MTQRLGNVMGYLRRLAGGAADADSDRALLGRFARDRDEAAFAELVSRHGTMVLNVCRRVLNDEHAAEDAMQAVFLVLARKAASAGWQDSLAGWLHETAQRTALKARTARGRLEQRERHATPMSTTDLASDLDWRELRGVLDDELARLPEKYRAPLVLCYLEGKSNEEAARALHWTKGTVSGRLARARELLRDRLARRGLTLGAAGLIELIAVHAVEASLSQTLTEATVRAATRFAWREAASAAAPASSIHLAEGVLHAMFLAKIKYAVVFALALAFVAGIGLFAGHRLLDTSAALAVAVVDPAPARLPQQDLKSRPVTHADAEFVLDTRQLWIAPVAGQNATIRLGLTITNRAREARTFLPCSGDVVLKDLKGKVIAPESLGLRALRRRLAYEPIEPGKGLRFADAVTLHNDGGSLSLQWERVNGERMAYVNLQPGKYQVALRFVQQSAGLPVWGGDVTTEFLTVELVPGGVVRSKPLVADGVSFEVVTLPVWQLEAQLGPQDAVRKPNFPLALRISNAGKAARKVVPWRGEPVLKKPDGTLLPVTEHGRNGVRKRPELVTLAPGQAIDAAESVFLTSGDSKLSYLDGTGTVFTIDDVKPGKYQLSLKYQIDRAVEDEWVGNIETAPVEITIQAAQRVLLGTGDFWGFNMPDTRPFKFVPAESKLLAEIQQALDNPRLATGFVVPGTELPALEAAHAVLVKGQEPARSLQDKQAGCLVLFARESSVYAQVRALEVTGQVITVRYRLVGHETKERTSHFALAPLPALKPGKYSVKFLQVDSDYAGGAQPMCGPFEFAVLER